jgi:predicted nucleic acid-binding protein
MDRVVLDTNLLLDFVLDRKPFSEQAEIVIATRLTHKKKLFASTLSFVNVAYVVRKAGQNPFKVIEELFEWIQVVSLTQAEFELSLRSNFKDFEDALQFYSALSMGVDLIITRDLKGFVASTIPVKTPLEYLKALSR